MVTGAMGLLDDTHLKNFMRNKQYTNTNNWYTSLSPEEEQQYQNWVNNISKTVRPIQADDPTYDMRGYWKGTGGAVPTAKNLHFPDTYKTPYHPSFSNESQYANQNAPKWNGKSLVDALGQEVYNESWGD